MLDKNSFKGGLDLNFFPDHKFESLDIIASSEQAPVIARNALRLLMMGWPNDWHRLVSWPTFKAVFIRRDGDIVRELRFAFQQGFEHIFTQLKDKKLNEEENEQFQLYLSNCLSLLPYSDLTPYESIKIPQWIEDQWLMVEYHITPIELTEQTGIQSLILEDHDRVFAYGLEPIVHSGAERHLIFMGTTYPAGQGFMPQIKTDLKAFETVGESLYRSGKDRISKWLLKYNDKVHVCGVSLGGSLSLLLSIDQGHRLSRVDAFNPAGLHKSFLYENPHDNWDTLESIPKVVVQQQANDPVSAFGIWKKEWEILSVIPPKDRQGPNAFFDHFLNYAGFSETEFTYINPVTDNKNRILRNVLLYSIGRALVYYPLIVPFNYMLRPVMNFIWNNIKYLSLSCISLLGFTALFNWAALGFLPVLALGISAFLLTFLALPRMFNNRDARRDVVAENNSVKYAKLHDPSLKRNSDLDIYNDQARVEIKLKREEMGSYNKVMSGLLKQDECLLDENKLLDQSKDSFEETVCIKITKAKAIHIKHTLSLLSQSSSTINDDELQQELKDNYRQYARGKP